ncbi:MAG: KR domain-containing protein [Methylococcaceae bacterium]|nr:MAG: KR domain-containing protein [Methylococcaceae bacterium]
MKKLLFQFDTDAFASVFDTVVAYDGGADQVMTYAGVTPDNVGAMVEGAIFTRPPKQKKFTALFVGGGNLEAGQNLLQAIRRRFFGDFRVSVMLDSNGGNTTAAAIVAKLAASGTLAGKKAVVLGGTGPVGQRAAVMLIKEGAREVVITSRKMAHAEEACEAMRTRFGVELTPVVAVTSDDRAQAIADAQIVVATGATGVTLLEEHHWQNLAGLEMLADANTTPPLGILGMEMYDKGVLRHGKVCWGAIGFGAFKLAVHRACIEKLFEANDQILDAEEVFALAKLMA